MTDQKAEQQIQEIVDLIDNAQDVKITAHPAGGRSYVEAEWRSVGRGLHHMSYATQECRVFEVAVGVELALLRRRAAA
jgi:hypothetical protein